MLLIFDLCICHARTCVEYWHSGTQIGVWRHTVHVDAGRMHMNAYGYIKQGVIYGLCCHVYGPLLGPLLLIPSWHGPGPGPAHPYQTPSNKYDLDYCILLVSNRVLYISTILPLLLIPFGECLLIAFLVDQKSFFRMMKSVERAGVPTKFPHCSGLYEQLVSKSWTYVI